MPGPTLNAPELAAELGRSCDWLYDNWRGLCDKQRMPSPVQHTVPLAWSRAQIYAWLDRNLPRQQQVAAAAYRAAAAAAEGSRHTHGADAAIADARADLDRRFAPRETGKQPQ